METCPHQGLFLTLPELQTLFSRLKNMEGGLTPGERKVLLKIERTLYEYLSVEELEALLQSRGGAG